jgi:glycosyltransferase involved in cell wall biosynthesis
MFTIGICSSDRKDYLLEALESIYTQDYLGPINVVIADDNSTTFNLEDSLKPIADKFNNRHIKLRLIKNRLEDPEQRSGEGAMRNLVIAHCTKDVPANQHYIIWLDDDDKLITNAISTYAQAIEQDPINDVFYGNLIRTDENFIPKQKYNYRDIPRALLPSSLLLGSMIPNGGSCIKKSVFEKIGRYDQSFKIATEYQFWARASLGPIRFKHINKDIYLYRAHDFNAALDKEETEFLETNGRVCELLLQHCPPNHLFPFFEWESDRSFAECQLTLTVLTLSKRNQRTLLVENCQTELKNNEEIKKHLTNSTLSDILEVLESATNLNFEQTAEILSQIVAAGQK